MRKKAAAKRQINELKWIHETALAMSVFNLRFIFISELSEIIG